MLILKPSAIKSNLKRDLPASAGSVAFIYCVDNKLIDETIEHAISLKFSSIFIFIHQQHQYVEVQAPNVHFVHLSLEQPEDFFPWLRPYIAAARGHWVYWGYNAEFFCQPYFETRTVNEFGAFLLEERRKSAFGIVVDSMPNHNDGDILDINLKEIAFDYVNYFFKPNGLVETLVDAESEVLLRAPDVRGGLRWRANYYSENSYSLTRIAFFFVDQGLEFDEKGIANSPEFYTHQCEHHRSPTTCIISLRLYLDLMHNPQTRSQRPNLNWGGMKTFDWTSEQLFKLGFMEPGQWF